MKKKLVIVFLCLFSLTCFAEEVGVTGNAFKQPKIWDEGGTPKGILIDIMNLVGKKMGHKFDIHLYPWKRAYIKALKSKVGIVGLSITEERLKLFDYSEVLFYDEVILIVKKGNEFKFDNFEDLEGKHIGVCRGCSFGPEYEQAKKFFTPQGDNESVQRLHKLKMGRIDAAIISPGEAALNIAVAKDDSISRDDFSILPKPITRDPNYFAFAKSNDRKAFIAEFNKVLRVAHESGAIKEIISRY